MRKYGQHFLVNKGIIEKIVESVLNNQQPNILEIGPGKGALTNALLERGLNNFTLVEIDPDMVTFLKSNLPSYAEVNIINQNFLDVNCDELTLGRETIFVSNLPYIDAAEILCKTLDSKDFKAAVYMFQREQAQRILAKPESKHYGPLSVIAQAMSEPTSVCRVSPGSFNPPPKVDSEVLLFKPRNKEVFVNEQHKKNFKEIVKAAFAYRRKTILNAFTGCFGYKKEDLILLLKKSSVPVSARAEQLSVRQYIDLAANLNT